MAIISLEPGETLTVMFNGVEDHEFEIHHDSDEYEGKIVVVESGGVSGSEAGEANEILFSDELPESEGDDEESDEESDEDEEGDDEEGDDESEEGSGEEDAQTGTTANEKL